jgi:hypothetical protein
VYDDFFIGVVGYSKQQFDDETAQVLLREAFDTVVRRHSSKIYTVVSGLTNLGIPGIAYRMAKERDWKTIGIACELAKNYPCFNVDKEIIIGKRWGEESSRFLKECTVLVRVGGGPQSIAEATEFNKTGVVYEYELPAL